MHGGRCSAVAFALSLLVGCSSHPPAGEMTAEATTLQELNDLLHSAAGRIGHPPAKLSDLDRYQSMFHRAYWAVKSGDVVVLWGTPLKGEGEVKKDEKVVAYQKNALTEGGYVLFTDGTVKKLTAGEFAAGRLSQEARLALRRQVVEVEED